MVDIETVKNNDIIEKTQNCEDGFFSKFKIGDIDTKFFGLLHKFRQPRCKTRIKTVDLDNPAFFKDIRDMLSPLPLFLVTRTSRGYHLLVDISQKSDALAFLERGNSIWEAIQAKYWDQGEWDAGGTYHPPVELMHEPQEPVPGTLYYRTASTEPNYVTIIE